VPGLSYALPTAPRLLLDPKRLISSTEVCPKQDSTGHTPTERLVALHPTVGIYMDVGCMTRYDQGGKPYAVLLRFTSLDRADPKAGYTFEANGAYYVALGSMGEVLYRDCDHDGRFEVAEQCVGPLKAPPNPTCEWPRP
jgi:hypothetical protein